MIHTKADKQKEKNKYGCNVGRTVSSIGELEEADCTTTRKVAVKVLKEGVSTEARIDFEREVEIMSAFDHDNILRLLGTVQTGMVW